MSTFEIKHHILSELRIIVSTFGVENPELKLDESKHRDLGDLSCAIAMSLSKKLGHEVQHFEIL